MTPDVNVLVAASRSDHPHHAVAYSWLEESIGDARTGAAFTLMPKVVASFLRLVTSPRIFQTASPIEDAVAFIDALMASPGVQLAPLGPEWAKLRLLCHAWPTLVRRAVAMSRARLMTLSVSSASGSDEQQLQRRGRLRAVGAA